MWWKFLQRLLICVGQDVAWNDRVAPGTGAGIVLQVNSEIENIEVIVQSQLDKKLFRMKSFCMSLSRSALNDLSMVRNFSLRIWV
jgi:hypothetical protein